jgi:hypothetical protein
VIRAIRGQISWSSLFPLSRFPAFRFGCGSAALRSLCSFVAKIPGLLKILRLRSGLGWMNFPLNFYPRLFASICG